MTSQIQIRLEEKLKLHTKLSPKGCLEWTRSLTKAGYGQIVIGYEHYYVHRLVLELKLGRPIRKGYDTAHSCDNPRCVLADHLVEQTHSSNIRDGWRK